MKILITFFAALFLLTGCATVSTPKFEVGNTFSAKPFPPLKEGMARVIFVRPRAPIVLIYEIYDGENIFTAGASALLLNKTGLCHVYDTTPGEHLFSLSNVAGTGVTGDIGKRRYTFLESQLQAGREYYVFIKAYSPWFAGFFADMVPLSPRSEYVGQLGNWLSECQISTIGEDAKQWAASHTKELGAMRSEHFQKLNGKSKFGKLMDTDGFPPGTTFPVSSMPEEKEK